MVNDSNDDALFVTAVYDKVHTDTVRVMLRTRQARVHPAGKSVKEKGVIYLLTLTSVLKEVHSFHLLNESHRTGASILVKERQSAP